MAMKRAEYSEGIHRTVDEEHDLRARMERTIEHAGTLIRCDPATAIAHASEAIEIAVKLDDPRGIAEGLRIRGHASMARSDFAAALDDVQRARELFAELGDEERVARVIHLLAVLHNQWGDLAKAYELFNEYLSTAQRLGDLAKVGAAYNGLGHIYCNFGDYEKALECYTAAIHAQQEAGDHLLANRLESNLAVIFAEMGDIEKALETALRVIERRGTLVDAGDVGLLMNLGELYAKVGKRERARSYFQRSADLAHTISYLQGEALALALAATADAELGDSAEALAMIESALNQAAMISEPGAPLELWFQIGVAYKELRCHERAVEYLQKALEMAQCSANKRCEEKIHRALSEVFDRSGNKAGAYKHYRLMVEIERELEGEKVRKTIAGMRIRYELERAEKEREIYRLKSNQFEAEISHKEREMSAMALGLKRRNDLLVQMKKRIAEGLMRPDNERALLLELLGEIEQEENTAESYRSFVAEIDQHQQSFNRMLANRYPKLTPAELKICSFLRGNMSTKEIADILSVTTRNVETHRYNIRKKMQLPAEVHLPTFLASIG